MSGEKKSSECRLSSGWPRSCAADALFQETFLRAFKAYGSLPPGANVRAWLFAIATNLCRNHFRAEKRRNLARAAMSAELRGSDERDPERAMRFNEVRARIERAVSELPRKQRLAFVQRKFHGVDYDTIEQSLGCSAETARAHVFQALRKIRLALGSDGLV